MNDLLKKLAGMKAKQQLGEQDSTPNDAINQSERPMAPRSELGEQSSPDSFDPAGIDEQQLPSSMGEGSEQIFEETIADPNVPEEIRKAAIRQVREKYLGSKNGY